MAKRIISASLIRQAAGTRCGVFQNQRQQLQWTASDQVLDGLLTTRKSHCYPWNKASKV